MWQPPTRVTALTRICTKRRRRHSTFMQDARSYRTASVPIVPICTGTAETYRAPSYTACKLRVTRTHACLKCRFPMLTHTSQIHCGLVLLSKWKGKNDSFLSQEKWSARPVTRKAPRGRFWAEHASGPRSTPALPRDRLRKYVGIMENNARSLYKEPTNHRILKQVILNCLVSPVVYYHFITAAAGVRRRRSWSVGFGFIFGVIVNRIDVSYNKVSSILS